MRPATTRKVKTRMLKRRTRITAKAFGFLLLLSTLGAVGIKVPNVAEQVLAILCAAVPCVMWFSLLGTRSWAWWTLLVFYLLGLFGMGLYASDVLASSADDKLISLGALCALTLFTVGWPMVILLTDRPSSWNLPTPQATIECGGIEDADSAHP